MAKGGYTWSIDDPGPLGDHSKAKHDVYREYLRRYLRERTKVIGFDRYRINVVDGFAGGGIYVTGRDRRPYYGSPVILIETLREMQDELQARQQKPFLLDYRVHLVDADTAALDTLQKVLSRRGLDGLIGNRVFLHHATFRDALPSLLQDVQGRGKTIFLLDQYGYTDVPFGLLDRIFRDLDKPEVILTFAFDHLRAFVQEYKALDRALTQIGAGGLPQDEYDAAVGLPGGVEFLIQRWMHGAFLKTAGYFTPFFVTSRGDAATASSGSNLACWLLHLSAHPRARDVMTALHWELHNHFAHFGGAGQHMLGFDPAQAPGALQPFLFDDDARTRTGVALFQDIPREVAAHPEGVAFDQFHAKVCNGSPADSRIMREVIGRLAAERVIEVRTATGSAKRNPGSLQPSDRLIVPRQTTLILPSEPTPVFARQPHSLV